MNILLVGNGFDIAHGLKTKYTDFLEFIKHIIDKVNPDSSMKKTAFNSDLDEFIKLYDEEIYEQVCCNVWINELLMIYENSKLKNENWVDFEKEIGCICIKLIVSKDENTFKEYECLKKAFSSSVNQSNLKINGKKAKTWGQLIEILEKELNSFIRVFSNYLKCQVEGQDIKHIIPEIAALKIEKVVTFNYTHTFQKLYDRKYNVEYDYVHGEVKYDNTENIILGIESTDTEKSSVFSCFQKYHQRLLKGMKCNYIDWLNQIEKNGQDNILYVYGHSLDITDKDILINFLDNGNFKKIIIFYHDKVSQKSLVNNLVNIITANKVKQKTYSKYNQIEFKKVIGLEIKSEDEGFHIKICIYFLENFYLISDKKINEIKDYVTEKIRSEDDLFFYTQEDLLYVTIALHNYYNSDDLNKLEDHILKLAEKCVSKQRYETYDDLVNKYKEDDYITSIIKKIVEKNWENLIQNPDDYLVAGEMNNAIFDNIANGIHIEEIKSLLEESREETFTYNTNKKIMGLLHNLNTETLHEVECSEIEKRKLEHLKLC